MTVRRFTLLTAVLAAGAGAWGVVSCGSGDERPDPPSASEIDQHLTHMQAKKVGWAGCGLVPPDPTDTGDEMVDAASPSDFFDGTADPDGDFVPQAAEQLAMCSIGAQTRDAWVLTGEPVAGAVRFLNSTPETAEGGCTADYGVPWRVVFRYEDGSTFPLTVSDGGCGDGWNGEERRTVLNPLLDHLLGAAADDARR